MNSKRVLANFLNHLPSIPNEVIGEEDRVCSICWESYGSDGSATSNVSYTDLIRSSASTSCVALVKTCPFAQNENRSMSDIIVKTEICVEHEALGQTYTHYQRRDQDRISTYKDNDNMLF